LSGQSLDIDVLVDNALCVEQIVPAKPPTPLLSAVGNVQILAVVQQSSPQALNDSLLGSTNLHAVSSGGSSASVSDPPQYWQL